MPPKKKKKHVISNVLQYNRAAAIHRATWCNTIVLQYNVLQYTVQYNHWAFHLTGDTVCNTAIETQQLCACDHTHAHTYTPVRTHPQHSQERSHCIHTAFHVVHCIHTHTGVHGRTFAHAHGLTHTLDETRAHARNRRTPSSAHAHARKRTNKHTHTHTHTHALRACDCVRACVHALRARARIACVRLCACLLSVRK